MLFVWVESIEVDMILITLGSQKFQFDRLLKAVDRLTADGKITDKVFAQTGYSDYVPKHYDHKQFLDRDEFEKLQNDADIIITHGGTGAIVGALKKGKKVIAVPRLEQYGEHVDDHQLQIVEQFVESGFICECEDCSRMDEVISRVKKMTFKKYQSNTQKYVDSIEEFIGEKV